MARATSTALGAPDIQPDHYGSNLASMRGVFDHVNYGVVLLDRELRSRLINRAFREIWRLPNEKADNGPTFTDLVQHGRDTNAYAVPGSQMDAYVAQRIELVRAANMPTLDLRLNGDKTIRLHCKPLSDGARVLTYFDVTDLVCKQEQIARLLADPLRPADMSAGNFDAHDKSKPARAVPVPWQVRRAERYIEANWDRPLNMEAIADAIGASERTIFRAFQQARGYSPKAYAKRLRLQHARRMLESAGKRITVTDVAFACGFSDLSHFTRDFRRSFGELPSCILECAKGD